MDSCLAEIGFSMFNDISNEEWSRLRLFLSRDVLERRYQARHNRELGTDKAKEIIAHLDQARQSQVTAAWRISSWKFKTALSTSLSIPIA
jgi:hypothetical protein